VIWPVFDHSNEQHRGVMWQDSFPLYSQHSCSGFRPLVRSRVNLLSWSPIEGEHGGGGGWFQPSSSSVVVQSAAGADSPSLNGQAQQQQQYRGHSRREHHSGSATRPAGRHKGHEIKMPVSGRVFAFQVGAGIRQQVESI